MQISEERQHFHWDDETAMLRGQFQLVNSCKARDTIHFTHTHTYTDRWTTLVHTQKSSRCRNANKHQPVCSCWWLFTSLVFTVTLPRSLTHECKHTSRPHTIVFDLMPDAINSEHTFPNLGPKWRTDILPCVFLKRSYETNLPISGWCHCLLEAVLILSLPAALHSHCEQRQRKRERERQVEKQCENFKANETAAVEF